MALKQAAKGGGVLLLGSVAFFVGMIAWAAASGLIGGVLDSVGIVIGAETYLAVSPLAGLLAAGWTVQEVSG